MLKSKEGEVKIRGTLSTIKDEFNEMCRALYLKELLSAEDFLLLIVKSIIEAEDIKKTEDETE